MKKKIKIAGPDYQDTDPMQNILDDMEKQEEGTPPRDLDSEYNP